MAVIQLGYDRWKWTRGGGGIATSEAAARFQDDREFLKQSLEQDRIGDEAWASHPPEVVRAMVGQLIQESDRKVNEKIGADLVAGFCSDHPEFVGEGFNGALNGKTLRTWLLDHGHSWPCSPDVLENAFDELADRGELILTNPPKRLTDNDLSELTTEEIFRRAGGIGTGF